MILARWSKMLAPSGAFGQGRLPSIISTTARIACADARTSADDAREALRLVMAR